VSFKTPIVSAGIPHQSSDTSNNDGNVNDHVASVIYETPWQSLVMWRMAATQNISMMSTSHVVMEKSRRTQVMKFK